MPGFNSVINVINIFDGLKNDNYEFIGEGLKNGQCGIRLLSANRNNTGKVSCKMIFEDKSEQTYITDLNILHPIEKLEMSSNSNGNDYEYVINQWMEFTCTAVGGNPAPTYLFLLIGM